MRKEDGESLGFGFVCFKEPACAARALAEVQGQLYVRQALPKAQRLAEVQRASERFKAAMARFNLYFKLVPKEATEEELRDHFSQYGEIKSLRLMRNAGEAEGAHLGFGFVSFATIEAAAKARIESKRQLFKGVQLHVCQFETRQSRTAHLEETRDRRQLENYKQLMRSSAPPAPQQMLPSTSTLTLAQLIQVLILLKQVPANQDFVMPAPPPQRQVPVMAPPPQQQRSLLVAASPLASALRRPQSFQAQVQAVLQSENYKRADRKAQRELLGNTLYSHVAALSTP